MGIDNPEQLGEEPTSGEIAEACREALGDDVCAEIEEMEDAEAALGLTFTALIEAGIEDPEEYLRSRGVLE
ncbi:hypothetical protein CO046_03320 [Candidatus Peregrinibacteria bacterium CG_4_9_14_0_2_um_filter_53_11]|nr:MAG: hypothetical protein CO046_03320 [Candidatus Peregrinibacteria bacterium CG_4_9_14_0_2_um_filter_53_11]